MADDKLPVAPIPESTLSASPSIGALTLADLLRTPRDVLDQSSVGLAGLLRAPDPKETSDSDLLDALEKYMLWDRAKIVDGYDAAVWRKDRFGWWIRFDEYGKLSTYGWEKDHVIPSSLGGADALDNLAATHHSNNRRRGARFIG